MEKYESTINDTLLKIGRNNKEISATELKKLVLIEEYINNEFDTLTVSLRAIHNIGFNIMDVSNNINISRTTLYKYPVIAEYLEQRSKEYLSILNRFITEKTFKGKNLVKENINLKKRDVEFMELKIENERLKKEIQNLNKELKKYSKKLN